MAFLHSSRGRGRVSAPLKAAADVRYLGHTAKGDETTLLHFEVAPFGDAAKELFRQQLLWDDGPKADETAFEVLAAALHDVGIRRADSNRFDPAFLRRIGSYARMLKRGIERITLPDVSVAEPGSLDAMSVEAANELSAITPRSRRVRVMGRLDVMGASQGVLKIHLRPGEIVTAIWEGRSEIDTLRELFNRDVVVEGAGVFRPSGSLLRIDADAITEASAQDEFFRDVPKGLVEIEYSKRGRLRAGEQSVYARILGCIPAEESDEEFAAAVEAMS